MVDLNLVSDYINGEDLNCDVGVLENNPDFSLEEFLNDITLQSDQDRISEDAISIMSVHASKGLEFEHVFIIGLEEGFFPLISD